MVPSTLWRHYYTYLSQLIDIIGYLHSMTSLLCIFITVNWYSWFSPLYDVIIIHIYPSYLIFLVPSTLWRHYCTYLSQLIDIIGYLHSMTSLLCIFITVNWYSWFSPLYDVIIIHIYPSYLIFLVPSTLWRHYCTYLSQLIDIIGYLHSMTSLLCIFIPVNWYSWFPPLYDVIIIHIYPS